MGSESQKPKSHGLMSAVIIIVVVIGASLIGAYVLKGSPNATTSSGATSQVQTLGTSTQAVSTRLLTASASGPVSVSVTRTTVDNTTVDAQTGSTVYIYDVALTGSDSASHPVAGSYFTLVGSGGASYQATPDKAVRTPLPNATLATGTQAAGQVAFQVPNSDNPAKLEYKIPGQGVDVVVTDLPSPSRWVSSIAAVKATWKADSTNSNYFVAAVIQNNSSELYYSTDIIPVKVEITPYNTDDIVLEVVPDLTVTSAFVSTIGFSISSVSPPFPVTVANNGNEVDFMLYVTLPNLSLTVGSLDLTLTTS